MSDGAEKRTQEVNPGEMASHQGEDEDVIATTTTVIPMVFPFVIAGAKVPHIAKRIFSYCDGKTLSICRQTHTGWKEEAEKTTAFKAFFSHFFLL